MDTPGVHILNSMWSVKTHSDSSVKVEWSSPFPVQLLMHSTLHSKVLFRVNQPVALLLPSAVSRYENDIIWPK